LKKLLLALTIPLLFEGCFSFSTKATSYSASFEPNSHQVEYIESSSSSELMVLSTGIGEDLESAVEDSRKASIWFALFGKNGALQNRKEKTKFRPFAEEFYTNSSHFITFESPIKSKRVSGKSYRVSKIFKVNRELLLEKLIEKNIVKEADEVSNQLSNPLISIVFKTENSNSYHGGTVLQNYLTNRGFEVEVSKSENSIDKTLDKSLLMSGDMDMNYKLAISSGSDLFISLSVNVAERTLLKDRFYKASVSAKAYSTVSKKLLGSATGYSQELQTSSKKLLVEEAVNDLSDSLTSQILKKWKSSIKSGKEFRVLLKSTIPNVDRELYSIFKESGCTNIKRKAGATIYDFQMRCKKAENSFELLQLLQDSYRGEGAILREFDTGSLLVIKIGSSSSSDDIVFE
jgi:hypothetical protein